MSEKYNEADFLWDCMFEYTEIAMNKNLLKENEHLNEQLDKMFWSITNFYYASNYLENKWDRQSPEFGNAVTWHCFYGGLLLEKIREENPEQLEETFNKIINGELDPIEEIDKYTLKHNPQELSSLIVEVNEKGNELRQPYMDDKSKSAYIWHSYLAAVELGSAIQEEMKQD